MYDIPTLGDITIYQCRKTCHVYQWPTKDITIMNQSTTNFGKWNFFLCESQGESQVREGLLVTVPEMRWDDKLGMSVMWVLQKWQIWQEFIEGLVKIKTRQQNRHVDNCGLYENDKCCKVGKDSSKVCENCLLMISNFYNNNNLCENGEFGKNLSKVWQKLR